jgi:hypothetical protein
MLNFAKAALLLAFLLTFAAIGIGCAFNPDWGMKHFGRSLMGGGELRKRPEPDADVSSQPDFRWCCAVSYLRSDFQIKHSLAKLANHLHSAH